MNGLIFLSSAKSALLPNGIIDLVTDIFTFVLIALVIAIICISSANYQLRLAIAHAGYVNPQIAPPPLPKVHCCVWISFAIWCAESFLLLKTATMVAFAAELILPSLFIIYLIILPFTISGFLLAFIGLKRSVERYVLAVTMIVFYIFRFLISVLSIVLPKG